MLILSIRQFNRFSPTINLCKQCDSKIIDSLSWSNIYQIFSSSIRIHRHRCNPCMCACSPSSTFIITNCANENLAFLKLSKTFKIDPLDYYSTFFTVHHKNHQQSVFTDLEIVSALFAAAIHDIDHPGVTNQYLIKCSNEVGFLMR